MEHCRSHGYFPGKLWDPIFNHHQIITINVCLVFLFIFSKFLNLLKKNLTATSVCLLVRRLIKEFGPDLLHMGTIMR